MFKARKKEYQLDIFGNWVSLDYIKLCKDCDRKYKLKVKRGFNNVSKKK